MDYDNKRVIISGIPVPNSMIAKGSYSFRKEKRKAGAFTNAMGIDFVNYYDARKTIIEFSLRERSLEEQKSISELFELDNIVDVTYWDDYKCAYATGSFYVNAPTINHLSAINNDIQYASTKFKLEER